MTTPIASDPRAKELIGRGDRLFSKRASWMSQCQEIANNFYVERADFTAVRTIGEDFAAGLSSSYPLIVRRELGDAIGSMLRRKDTEWLKMTVDREERLDNSGRQFLEWATGVQRRAMYDRQAGFERTAKQCDHDYVAFGQGVITVEVNWDNVSLLYRNWHLRDVAWCDGPDGSMHEVHHNLKMSAKELQRKFPGKLHYNVTKCLEAGKDPYTEFNCRRIMLRAEHYGDLPRREGFAWVSVYVDVDNGVVLEEAPQRTAIYVIPRWAMVSGSQYALSPAVTAGLPDARLLQSMALTLIEASEMAVRPPMLATGEVIQGGIQLYAGGITQIDAQYDERLGSPLRPVIENPGSLPFSLDFERSKQDMLARAFYLNKLRALPAKEMTAYEASVWAEDWIREAVPLFEPLETEYNAAICEISFETLLHVNAFGPIESIPRSILGQNVSFKFNSPLSRAIEAQKGQKMGAAGALIEQAVIYDPSAGAIVDFRVALRDALNGVGIPAKWMRSEEVVEKHASQMQQQKAAETQAAQEQQMAATAETATKAAANLAAVA